jgi:hypothetical protein
MATITIYLSYQAPNLMWRNSPSDAWQVMGPDSTTASTTAGDTVAWAYDDSIKKIKNIKVGKKTKISAGYKWKDIWSSKPKSGPGNDEWTGVVSTGMRKGDADDISVQIKNGADVTVDPGVVVIDPPV